MFFEKYVNRGVSCYTRPGPELHSQIWVHISYTRAQGAISSPTTVITPADVDRADAHLFVLALPVLPRNEKPSLLASKNYNSTPEFFE